MLFNLGLQKYTEIFNEAIRVMEIEEKKEEARKLAKKR